MAGDSSEASFKLQDRTALLVGPTHTTNQAIAMRLTQLGTNVAMLVPKLDPADKSFEKTQRFAQQLMDTREINERYGRAFAIHADLTTTNGTKDAVSRAAEAFGGVDIYVDGNMATEARRFREPNSIENLDRMIDANLRGPLLLTQAVLRFLEGRKRGRVIYLLHDILRTGLPLNALGAGSRTGLQAFARTLSREVAEFNVTVNCVAIGVSEELLQSQFEQAEGQTQPSIQEAQQRLLQVHPTAQIMDPERAANLIAFLASPLGVGITGQTVAVSQGLTFLS